MAENINFKYFDNKFIFTNEGKTAFIAQNGGVRLALLGGFFIQGLKPVDPELMFDTYRELTYETLLANEKLTFGFKGISYDSAYNDKVRPSNDIDYNVALQNPTKYLYGTRYLPSLGVKDTQGNHYGTYDFEFDKTSFTWDHLKDVSFAHIALIGKQYSEVNDAAYNVNAAQNPVLIGIAQIAGNYNEETEIFRGGLQFLANQESYMGYKIQIRFTVTTDDKDLSTDLNIDHVKDVMEMTEKLNLVNNGLKTNNNVRVLGNIRTEDPTKHHTIEEDLSLSDEGSIVSQRTFMVADSYNADDLENQFNAAGLVHVINKKDQDNDYKPQIVVTTLQQPESYVDSAVTAYSVAMSLNANGKYLTNVKGASAVSALGQISALSGNETPIFKLNNIPEYDDKAVDIFGSDNKLIGEDTLDKLIFSKCNAIGDPANPTEYGYNTLFASNENFILEQGANTNNTLIKSDGNIINAYANTNLLLGSDQNLLQEYASTNILIGSDVNVLANEETYGNVLIGTKNSYLHKTNNVTIIHGEGINAAGMADKVIFGRYNAPSTADIVLGAGTSDTNRYNMFEVTLNTPSFKFLNANGNNSQFTPTGLIFNEDKTIYSDNVIAFNYGETLLTNNHVHFNNKQTILEPNLIKMDNIEINTTGLSINNGYTKFGQDGIIVNNGETTYTTAGINIKNGTTFFNSEGIGLNNSTTVYTKDGVNIHNGQMLFANNSISLNNGNAICNDTGLIFNNTAAAIYLGKVGNYYENVITNNGLSFAQGNITLGTNTSAPVSARCTLTIWGADNAAVSLNPHRTEYWTRTTTNAVLTAIGSKHATFEATMWIGGGNDISNWGIAVYNISDDLDNPAWINELTGCLMFGQEYNNVRYYRWIDQVLADDGVTILETGASTNNVVNWSHHIPDGKIDHKRLVTYGYIPALYDSVILHVYCDRMVEKMDQILSWIPATLGTKQTQVDMYIHMFKYDQAHKGSHAGNFYFWAAERPIIQATGVVNLTYPAKIKSCTEIHLQTNAVNGITSAPQWHGWRVVSHNGTFEWPF